MIYILRESEDYMPSTTLGVYNDFDVAMQARDERIKTYNNEDELHLTGGTFTNGVLNDGYISGVYKVTVTHADDLGRMDQYKYFAVKNDALRYIASQTQGFDEFKPQSVYADDDGTGMGTGDWVGMTLDVYGYGSKRKCWTITATIEEVYV
jgi:hypothetical protein